MLPTEAITRNFLAAYSDHDIDRMMDMCAENLRFRYVPQGAEGTGGRDTARRAWSMFVDAIPDFHVEVDRILAAGDFAVAETRQGGELAKDIPPMKANGRSTHPPHVYILRFDQDGKIAEVTCYWDQDGIYADLGHTEVHS